MKQPTKLIFVALIVCLSTGCSTAPRKRFLIGAGVAGAGGALGGALLTPNEESRGLNTLVFGLIGALVGGLGSLLFHDDAEIPESAQPYAVPSDLKRSSLEFVAPESNRPLPSFVKDRLVPTIVEELTEPDSIGDDGSLHEPHKVYRIKRQAELIARPIDSSNKGGSK